MSRPGIRDRLGAGGSSSSGARKPPAVDKFIGLVEKERPSGFAGGPSSAVPDPSIRSSGLQAPFGQQSAAAPATRGGGKLGGNGGVVASGNKSFDRIFVHARRTGVLSMENMSLTEVPPQVSALYDEASITSDEKFWECVDLTTLNLQHNAITTIPSGITNLMHLQVVILGHNKLKGLPEELFDLVSIKKLDVQHNLLSALSPSISKLSSLVELNLSHNPELKTLPDEICDCQRLEVFSAEACSLEELPPDFGEMRQLLRVNLNSNHLTSLPPSFQYLTRLSELSVKQNRLQSEPQRNNRTGRVTGGMPSFASCRELITLDLSENQLTRIPDLPSGMKLQQLFLGFNQLTDAQALASCAGLVTLDLHNNRLLALPSFLGQKESTLKLIDCSNNDLQDIPGELGLIAGLNKLLVEGNPLRKFPRAKLQGGSGASIQAFKKYLVTRIDSEKLRAIGGEEALELDGGGAGGGGGGGLAMSNNPNLEYALREGTSSQTINLSKLAPPLTAFPAAAIFGMPSVGDIHTLDVSNQRIAPGAMPEARQWQAFRKLVILHASNMQWDAFPVGLCSVRSLQEIVLNNNALKDLPLEFRNFTALINLELSQNRFPSFPRAIEYLAQTLTHLQLANNRLAALPEDFCARFHAKLQWLDLQGNQLTTLPDGWRWFSRKFEYLNVENCQLSSVPLELGLLEGLKTLLLNGNPQRTVLYQVIAKGTPAVLAALKNKIPASSPLLLPGHPSHLPPAVDELEQEGDVVVDTSLRREYRESMRGGGGGGGGREQRGPATAAYDDRRNDDRSYDPPPRQTQQRDEYSRGCGNSYGAASSSSSRSAPREDTREDTRGYAPRYARDARSYEEERGGRAPSYPAEERRRDPYYAEERSGSGPSRDADASEDRRRSGGGGGYEPAPSSSSQSRYAERDAYDARGREEPRGGPAASAYGRSAAPAYSDREPQRSDPRYDVRGPAQSSARPSAAPMSSSSSASGDPSAAKLQSDIDHLTHELENNLQMSTLQKQTKKKELASLKATLNRMQRG